MYLCEYVCVCIYVSMCVFMCMCVCVFVYLCMCIRAYLSVCMCVRLCVYVGMFVYVYVYISTINWENFMHENIHMLNVCVNKFSCRLHNIINTIFFKLKLLSMYY